MTVQTAFRFTPELIARMKNRARLESKSVNQFVEEAIEKALSEKTKKEQFENAIREIPYIEFIPEDILEKEPLLINDGDIDEKTRYIIGK